LGRQIQHGSGNGTALLLITVQQGRRCSPDDGVQFPSQVIGILHAGVETLTASWRMNMSRIADQENPAHLVASREPRIHAVCGCPRHRMEMDIFAPGARSDQGLQPFSGKVNLALQRERPLDLKQICRGQRTESNLSLPVAVTEAVPDITLKPRHQDIGNQGTHAKGLARETDVQRMADITFTAIRPRQPLHPQRLFTGRALDTRGYPLWILFKPKQLTTEFTLMPQLCQPFPHHLFR